MLTIYSQDLNDASQLQFAQFALKTMHGIDCTIIQPQNASCAVFLGVEEVLSNLPDEGCMSIEDAHQLLWEHREYIQGGMVTDGRERIEVCLEPLHLDEVVSYTEAVALVHKAAQELDCIFEKEGDERIGQLCEGLENAYARLKLSDEEGEETL